MKKFFGYTAVVLLVVSVAAMAAGWSFRAGMGAPAENYPAKAVYAPKGAIASSQPLASQAGLAVLQNGGNAIDAAVTAAAVLGVIEPHMSGLGGDLFAILWSADEQSLIGLNASGRSGSLMTRERLQAVGRIPNEGAKSVTVPGALSGWAALLESHGTITLAEAIEPAALLAESGFPVPGVTAQEWATHEGTLRQFAGARDTFLINGERTPNVGEWFSNPALGKTLRAIAAEGPELLYGGELGERIARHVQAEGGFLTQEDFAGHRAEWVAPIAASFGDHQVWQMPPNGQGIAVLEMLRILAPYDLAAMGHNSPDYLHHLIEAKKLAFADLEAAVGDPDMMAITPATMLSETFIAGRRNMLSPDRALPRANADPSLGQTDTTYLSVADEAGNMVSLIASVAGMFGSNIVVPNTGFPLQNRAVGLRYEAGYANSAGPGRRPFHTIIPGFVTKTGSDGRQEPWLSFGIVGGPQQPQAQVQVLLNMLLFGMNVQQALDAPRFRHWKDNQVSFEQAIPDATVTALRDRGHEPQNPLMSAAHQVFLGANRGLLFGGGQAVVRAEKGYVAGTDSRRDGLAAAY